MTTQTEALKLAHEELKHIKAWCLRRTGIGLVDENVLSKIEEALAHPEQDKERCVGCEACIDTACGRDECPKGWPKAPQPEQELDYKAIGQQAYESGYSTGYMDCAVKMKAQPEQEPIGYLGLDDVENLVEYPHRCQNLNIWYEGGEGFAPLYTTPPQRTWVGLTIEDFIELARTIAVTKHQARAIEAKLKEKNA